MTNIIELFLVVVSKGVLLTLCQCNGRFDGQNGLQTPSIPFMAHFRLQWYTTPRVATEPNLNLNGLSDGHIDDVTFEQTLTLRTVSHFTIYVEFFLRIAGSSIANLSYIG